MHNNCSRGRPLVCSDGGSNIIRIGDDFVRPNRNALNELSASCHQPTFTCHLKALSFGAKSAHVVPHQT